MPDADSAYRDWRSGPFMQSAQPSNLTAGLLCALGLCEAIKSAGGHPSTDADAYFAAQDGLKNHNSLIRQGLLDHGLIKAETKFADLPFGFKAAGRRANRRRVWAQALVDAMQAAGVLSLKHDALAAAIREHFQRPLADELRAKLNAGPLFAFRPALTLYTNIERILLKAKERNCHDQVAQALVAAKLIERYDLPDDYFGDRFLSAYSADSTRSGSDRRGDLPVGDLTFEVAHSPPDEEHINKAATRWKRGGYTLVVPDDQAKAWRNRLAAAYVDELASREEKLDTYVNVLGIIQFVAQNVYENAGKELKSHRKHFEDFFRRYNSLVQDTTLAVTVSMYDDPAAQQSGGDSQD